MLLTLELQVGDAAHYSDQTCKSLAEGAKDCRHFRVNQDGDSLISTRCVHPPCIVCWLILLAARSHAPDLAGLETLVLTSQIRTREETETSLMPPNFGELLSPSDLNALLAILISTFPVK